MKWHIYKIKIHGLIKAEIRYCAWHQSLTILGDKDPIPIRGGWAYLLIKALFAMGGGVSVPVPELNFALYTGEKQSGLIAESGQRWYGSTRLSMQNNPAFCFSQR